MITEKDNKSAAPIDDITTEYNFGEFSASVARPSPTTRSSNFAEGLLLSDSFTKSIVDASSFAMGMCAAKKVYFFFKSDFICRASAATFARIQQTRIVLFHHFRFAQCRL